MCGRYSLSTPPEVIAALFDLVSSAELRPRYNIAPSQPAPVVRLARDGTRRLDLLRWGLVPSWASDPSIGNRMINARAETIGERPAFRSAFQARRCLVPADGFYEWAHADPDDPRSRKQPYRIRLRTGGVFAMAGLWERWQPRAASAASTPPAEPGLFPPGEDVRTPPDQPIETFTIITGEANALVRGLHDRMPVIVPPEHWGTWLATSPDTQVLSLLQPLDPELMEFYPVSTFVNTPANDSPRCAQPLDPA